MKRFFSRHQTAFWGLCLLCALALGAVTGNRFTDDPDEGYSHGAKAGLAIISSGGTVGTIPNNHEKLQRPRNETRRSASGRHDRQRRRLDNLDAWAAAENPSSGVSGGGSTSGESQAAIVADGVSRLLPGLYSLPLKRQKQKEAGRCLTPDRPLLVSLEQIMKNKTNTYSGGAL